MTENCWKEVTFVVFEHVWTGLTLENKHKCHVVKVIN